MLDSRRLYAGYFTSRPAAKGYIRRATAFLQAARQLQALLRLHCYEGIATSAGSARCLLTETLDKYTLLHIACALIGIFLS